MRARSHSSFSIDWLRPAFPGRLQKSRWTPELPQLHVKGPAALPPEPAKPVEPKPAAPKPTAHAPPKPPPAMAVTPWESDLTNQLKERFGDQITQFSSYLGQNFLI